jgi:hypothetical protein
MYQFSVTNPINEIDAIKLLRDLSSLGVAEIRQLISSNSPILELDYREYLESMEFSEWCDEVKIIYEKLKLHFHIVTIGYAPSKIENLEVIGEAEFFNLLESQIIYSSQEFD